MLLPESKKEIIKIKKLLGYIISEKQITCNNAALKKNDKVSLKLKDSKFYSLLLAAIQGEENWSAVKLHDFWETYKNAYKQLSGAIRKNDT